MTTLQIGTLIVTEQKEITYCPSSYAADHKTVRLLTGEYAVRLMFTSGYLLPMPQWVLAGIACEIIGGAYYSGFGGVNFASTAIAPGTDVYHVQTYPHCTLDGLGEFKPCIDDIELLRSHHVDWARKNTPKWSDIPALAEKLGVPFDIHIEGRYGSRRKITRTIPEHRARLAELSALDPDWGTPEDGELMALKSYLHAE